MAIKKRLGYPIYLVVLMILLFCIKCSPGELEYKKSPLWGNLEKGPYAVGFTTSFHLDKTRSPVPYTDWQGNIYPTSETEGRQMQINVWYPGEPSNSRTLSYEHYVMLMGKQTDFTIADSTALRFGQEQFIHQTNALGGEGNFTLEKLNKLEALKTEAQENTANAKGKFPLILFPNGSSPAFQSIFCEYLASHGFVVAAMAPKGLDGFTNEASAKGIEVAVRDMEFTLDRLLQLPNVDGDNIGLIGNAITSSQITALQSRSDRINCLVSLEGGLISAFEQRLLNKMLFYEPHAINVPILAIYAPHPSIDPVHIAHLKYTDRYFVHFPKMKEFHFLNYGVFEEYIPEIIGAIDSSVRQSFELGSKLIHSFMAARLKGETGFEELHKDLANESSQLVDTTFYQPGLSPPPTLTIIKNGYKQNGFQFVESTYAALKRNDPQPFPLTYYSDMKDWLSWNGDDHYTARFRLYQLAYNSYPDNAEVNFYLGYYALETNQTDLTKNHYSKTRKLLESTVDNETTLSRKARILSYIKEDLRSIGAN